jgi:hypothetical protein
LNQEEITTDEDVIKPFGFVNSNEPNSPKDTHQHQSDSINKQLEEFLQLE